MFWRRKKSSSQPAEHATDQASVASKITAVESPGETESKAIFDFGGKAPPRQLLIRGSCQTSDTGDFQACVWNVEENTTNEPLAKYIIEF